MTTKHVGTGRSVHIQSTSNAQETTPGPVRTLVVERTIHPPRLPLLVGGFSAGVATSLLTYLLT